MQGALQGNQAAKTLYFRRFAGFGRTLSAFPQSHLPRLKW